jgi:hypothetical protein
MKFATMNSRPHASPQFVLTAEARGARRKTFQSIGATALVVVVPAALYALYLSYNLEYFYIRGAAVYDAGWRAWLSSNVVAWSMLNPKLIGGYFLGNHVSPIFYLTSALARILPTMPYAVWFCIWFSLWLPLLWFALYRLLAGIAELSRGQRTAMSLLLTLNGLSLSMFGFPHIESFIPPLLILTILGVQRGGLWNMACGGIAFAFALSMREDAGVHGVLAFVAIALILSLQTRKARSLLMLSAIGLTYGVLAIATQHLLISSGGQLLQGDYLGKPLLSQVTTGMIVHRLAYWGSARSYIFFPLALLTIAAFRWRDRSLALGILISLPWLALSLIANSPLAGGLWDYYCFPLLIPVLWPAVLASVVDHDPDDRKRHLRLQIGMGSLSSLCFIILGLLPGIGDGGSHDRAPWRYLIPPSATEIRTTEAALHSVEMSPGYATTIMDDGVASLSLGNAVPGQFDIGLKGLAPARATSFLRFDLPLPYSAVEEARLNLFFPSCSKIPGTPLELCQRY